MVRRRALRMRPINSVKNIQDSTVIGVAAGTRTNVVLADTVNDYTGGANQVPIGAKVSSIYLFHQMQPQAAQGNVDFYIYKRPNGITGFPAPGATGGNLLRKWILHEEKGIPGTFNNGASPLTLKTVIRIPRGMQRMAEGDQIALEMVCSTAYDACTKAIYKFYQ